MDVDALDDLQLQPRVVDLLLQGLDALGGPQGPGGHVHQGAHHTAHIGDLFDITQRYGVHLAPVPAKCHLHG